MGFVDHDQCKFLDLEMNKYMTSVWETEDGPIHLVPMEWARGLDKAGLLSLMYMSHFFFTTKVNDYVKHLLVSFHGGCLWLNQNIPMDVELIEPIFWIPLAGVEPTQFLLEKNMIQH